MSTAITRTDVSLVGRWWWTVDRWLLLPALTLIGIGVLLNFAAGPPAAERIGVTTFHFVQRQLTFLPFAVLVMLIVSLQPPIQVRRLAVVGFAIGIVLMLATLIVGPEVKGARRWLSFGGLSLQPSEFIKPLFAVVAAWMFAEQRLRDGFPGNAIAIGLMLAVTAILLSQPDIGMTLVVTAVWCAQFFIAGLPVFWVLLFAVAGVGTLVGAYFTFSHVAQRVDSFLGGSDYQTTQAMKAFEQGGWFGRGPGEGRVKESLPDAHTDFIFAVAGEEFGIFLCVLMVALFGFLVIRALMKAMKEENLFVLLAVGGLAVQFGLQAVINMASSLRMMPTKGMTLPFISYGGSSLVALGLGMGMILALTRRRRDLDGLHS
jgi:cell division protein FtsW